MDLKKRKPDLSGIKQIKTSLMNSPLNPSFPTEGVHPFICEITGFTHMVDVATMETIEIVK